MSSTFSAPAPSRPPLLKPLVLGLAAIGLFFGAFGTWAVITPLASAASAPGTVRVESYRKTVQHLEGGIIRDIFVREGELVRQGQALMRLDDVQTSASADALIGQVIALRALEARLIAERDGLDSIVFPPELEARRSDPQVNADLEGQTRILASRSASIAGQIEILTQRSSLLAAEMDAYRAQLAAAEDQIAIVSEEIAMVETLIVRGVERRPRLLALQRELAQLEGERGEQQGMIARSQQAIGETRLQVADLQNKRVSEVTAELRDIQTKLNELEERLRAATDVRRRTEIVAPEAGRVVQLRHVTPGGVLKPGEPILDLVPGDDRFVIEARVSPLDIDAVHPGLEAEVRFPALKQRRLPILIGTVSSISADALTDERSGATYYVAEINLQKEDLAELKDVKLYPGMPSDILILTGDRTPFDYFVDPIRESFQRAFREE